mgnify:CR=1 FL=1
MIYPSTIGSIASRVNQSGIPGASSAFEKALKLMQDAQGVQDASQQKYIDMVQAPRAAMPQQMPAMGQKESGIAAIVAALGALGGVRPQFLQQGIQGYAGAREQKAQMDYANQTNAYNAQNDQLSRNIQGQQIQLSGDAQKFAMAKDYFDKAGGDLERAKELYRIDNQNLQNRKWANEDYEKKVKDQEAKTFWSKEFSGPKKGVAHVESIIARGRQLGLNISPDQEESLREEGRQAALTEANKKAPQSEAAAKKLAVAYKLPEGTPEYESLLETGRTLGSQYKNRTDDEAMAVLQFLREGYAIRDAQSMARTLIIQGGQNQRNANTIGGANYRAELSQSGQNARQGITQTNVNNRTRYIREAIYAAENNLPMPSMMDYLGPISPEETRKVQAAVDAKLSEMGFSPLQPVLHGAITSNGTAPTRRDKTGSTKKNTAKATTAPGNNKPPRNPPPKGVTNGDETVFDFSGQKKKK